MTASEAGGLSHYVLNLCTALHAQGHHVAIAGDHGANHYLFEQAPWPWIDVPFNTRLPMVWPMTHRLRKFLKTWPVDVYHTHYRRATVLARSLQKRQPAPILYTVHLSHMSLRGVNRWLTDFGDHTHAPSQGARNWLLGEARVPAERVSLVPHGIDVHRFDVPTAEQRDAARAALSLAPDDIAAAYVGRFDDPKNLDWLLDLSNAARQRAPSLRLFLIGQGPQRDQLQRRIERDQLRDRVKMLNYGDPLPIYHAADLFLLPSWREGFSLACAEAMSCGLPAVRTATSGAADLILEGVTGRSTPIDRDAFVKTALGVINLPAAQRRAMGAAASAHIHAHYTLDRQIKQTVDLYRRLALK